MEERGKSELKGLEMEADLMNEVDEVGVTGLVGFEDEGSELPSLVRFFLRNPREGMGQTVSGQWVRESNRRGGEGGGCGRVVEEAGREVTREDGGGRSRVEGIRIEGELLQIAPFSGYGRWIVG